MNDLPFCLGDFRKKYFLSFLRCSFHDIGADPILIQSLKNPYSGFGNLIRQTINKHVFVLMYEFGLENKETDCFFYFGFYLFIYLFSFFKKSADHCRHCWPLPCKYLVRVCLSEFTLRWVHGCVHVCVCVCVASFTR